MSYEAEGNWIRSRFESEWAGRTAVAWENVPFSPPMDALNRAEPYVRFTLQRDGAQRRELGSTATRRFGGTVLVEVLTPFGTGTAENDELCEAVAEIFRDARGDGIQFNEPQVLASTSDEVYYKQDVLCPFERDAVITT